MKNTLIYLAVLFLTALVTACDENEVMPAYEKVGTATSTIVTIALPDPVHPSDVVGVEVSFVNPSADPLQSVVLRVKNGTDDYVDLETLDLSGAPKDELVTHTVNYPAPATVGTTVSFEVVITSAKEYPQRKRDSFTVEEP